jgi:hypothetical protein
MLLTLFFSGLCFCLGVPVSDAASGRKVTVNQSEPAQIAYDKGFAQQVMREGSGGVKLWNHLLIEDDAPGSGTSNKGAFMEPVYGDRMIKKLLTVDDPRCEKAHVVFYTMNSPKSKTPLRVAVNGREATFTFRNTEQYGYVPIDPSWLRKGDNEITFACPNAKKAEDGYSFLIARADEYVPGGGDPALVGVGEKTDFSQGIALLMKGKEEIRPLETKAKGIGNRSLVSANGGKTWSVTGKGLEPRSTDAYGIETVSDKNGVVGEYTARLNLQRYEPEGTLISPVIDLWSEPDKPAALIPFTEVETLTFAFRGTVPPGTGISWQIRAGLSMDPLSEKDWSEWRTVGSGASASYNARGRVSMPASHWDPERSVTLPKVRYIQWRAVLTTTDPLKSPVVESVSIDREITRRMEVPANIFVRDYHNPEIKYSSTGFTYQSADEPFNKEVIERDDLDKIVASSTGEFDLIVKMLAYSSRRWVYGGPTLEYPKWNTIDMAERAHSLGDGGMCIQHAAYLAHILTVVGLQARHVNIQYHEVVEVWSNEFDKWIYLDPTQAVDLYMYDKASGEPLSLCDMHKIYYEMYGVKSPIDWMLAPDAWRTAKPDPKTLTTSFSTTDPRVEMSHVGWMGYYELLDFLRMMPRNDFSTTTIPEPLAQGTIQWPWDGYLNWYDHLAPPKLQYSRHPDREADFWPDLNRVRFEAVPEINGDMVFITMSTFTPSFKTFQVRVDGGEWRDSDFRFNWRLHSGKNCLEMRALSGFGIGGHPSHIELNFVVKHIPKTISFGTMNQ